MELLSEPKQAGGYRNTKLSGDKAKALDSELQKLTNKQVFQHCYKDSKLLISPMFVVPKSNGSWRPVIDLCTLNQHVISPHFKMESIQTAFAERGLDGQIGPQRCIPIGTFPSPPQIVCSI